MTSAFTETGMQGFEQMQGVIRDFLQRMIELMKSTEFATALRNAMDMFLKIANVIVGVFKGIMNVWNWTPDWIKNGIVWFVKVQMILGVIAGIGQSILSTFIMIRGVLFGSWILGMKNFAGLMQRTLNYMIQLYAFSRHTQIGRIASIGQAIGRGFLEEPVY